MNRNFVNVDELFPQLSEVEKYFNEPGGYFFKKRLFRSGTIYHIFYMA